MSIYRLIATAMKMLGLSERIEQVCRPLNIRTIFKSSFTLRQSLVQVKNRTSADRKKGVVYEITCGDCEAVYIGETGRTLQKRVTTQVCSAETWHKEWHCCPCMEQRTQSRLGLSQSGGIGPIYLGMACDWSIAHPTASLNNESRLWPPYQPHMEPHPRSSLPTFPRVYQSPNLTPDYPWLRLLLRTCVLQNSTLIISTCMFIMLPLRQYSYIILSH